MALLFQQSRLVDYLSARLLAARKYLDELPEAGFNDRPISDLLAEATAIAECETLELDTQWIAGDVANAPTGPPGRTTWNVHVWAEYPWSGNDDLFWCMPTDHLMVELHGDLSDHRTIRIDEYIQGSTAADVAQEQVKALLDRTVGRIANMLNKSNDEVREHNRLVEADLRHAIDAKRTRVAGRLNLAEKLFPLEKRKDPLPPAPVQQKVLELRPTRPPVQSETTAIPSEWQLLESSYEEVLSIIGSMLKAIERTPSVAEKEFSVAAGRDHEEFLRDILLVSLNGTFEGTATGETFVKSGKTDILVTVDDQHVFVGECKWWDGPETVSEATEQLLGYMPWRNQKAALVFFIDRKGASKVLEKAEETLRDHERFKDAALDNPDPTRRRDYVLRHPSDDDREISLAMLFCVIQ